MSSFQVDPELLGVAASRMENYRGRILDLGTRSAVGDLGDAHLVQVVHGTEDAAARDLQQVARVLGGLNSFLRSAGTTYQGSDDSARACYVDGRR